ncbi:MAG: DUF1573 domain-containing protein [Odoribacteraceae bacterium]|jgi:hypothetical protein|nr:DUF1573 domain-containing protein [Odoribacteraceae bacterium]
MKILYLLLLAMPLGVAGQRPRVVFDAKSHDFGKIEADGGTVTRTFTFTNKGVHPVLVIDAESSCGCTVTGWSDHPVLPGQAGEVTVTFNPANLQGKFSKKITVYFTGDLSVRLKISGEVIVPPVDVSMRYPFAIGSLRASADTVYLHAGKRSQVIRLFNAGKRKISITSIVKPNDITVDQTPVVLLPGFRGDLLFLYSPLAGRERAADRVLINTSEGVTWMVNVNMYSPANALPR